MTTGGEEIRVLIDAGAVSPAGSDIAPLRVASSSLVHCVWFLLFVAALLAGLALRQKVWKATEPIRYRGDIANAFGIGTTVLGEARKNAGKPPFSGESVTWPQFFGGYVSLYDREAAFSDDQQYGLDYVPLRLLVMSSWVKYTRDVEPIGMGYSDDNAWPVLWFNTATELIAAVLMFLLVDFWIGADPARTFTDHGQLARTPWQRILHCANAESKWQAWLAALLLWFNPAVILEAHGWPQWDVWILPFYVGAMLLASTDRWFLAGLSLGIGCMFKGQLLMVAPVLLLWPLFLWRLGASARVFLGFGVGCLGVASVWLLPGPRPWCAVLTAAM